MKRVKRTQYGIFLLAGIAALIGTANPAAGQTTVFTYQGRLMDNGQPADNLYDMRFRLHDGAAFSTTICVDNVDVQGGLFTVPLDFGSAFPGATRLLEVSVRVNAIVNDCGLNQASYTLLSPDQSVTSAPYAIMAVNSGTLGGQNSAFYRSATNLNAGTVNDARLSSNVTLLNNTQTITGAKTMSNAANSFTGNGAGLTALNAGNLSTGTTPDARLSSNVALLNLAQSFTADKYFTGNIGIGTTTPTERLHIAGGNVMANEYRGGNGAARFISDLGQGTGGLQLHNVGGIDMIIDSDDNDTTRELRIMSNGADRATADTLIRIAEDGAMNFDAATAGLRFPSVSTAQPPMMTMFAGGFTNADRMVIGHSIASSNYGLQYQDIGDRFNFLSNGVSALTIDLSSRRVGIGTTAPAAKLEVTETQSVVRMTSTNNAAGSVLELRNNLAAPTYLGAVNFMDETGATRGQIGYLDVNDLIIQTAGAERVRVDSSGNTRFRAADFTNLQISDDANANQDNCSIDFIKNSNTTRSAFVRFDGYGNQNTHQASIMFGTRGSADSAVRDRMRIAESGELQLFDESGNVSVTIDGDFNGDGRVITQELQITGGSDLSEQFEIHNDGGDVLPGMVVCINAARPGHLSVSRIAYDATVAGIVSGAGGVKPGMLMGQRGTAADGRHAVALTGRVYCRCDAGQGAIKPGDLLTTSNTPGHAMKASDRDRCHGAIIGKAMEALDSGTGLVLVLVNLQ